MMTIWELVDYLTFDEDDRYYWSKVATEADMKYQLEVMWEEDEIDTRQINPIDALETIRACVWNSTGCKSRIFMYSYMLN